MSEDTRDDIEPVGEEVTYEQEYTDEISPIPVQKPVQGEDDDYAEPEGDESAEDVEPKEDDDSLYEDPGDSTPEEDDV